jgi:hypothetical protein
VRWSSLISPKNLRPSHPPNPHNPETPGFRSPPLFSFLRSRWFQSGRDALRRRPSLPIIASLDFRLVWALHEPKPRPAPYLFRMTSVPMYSKSPALLQNPPPIPPAKPASPQSRDATISAAPDLFISTIPMVLIETGRSPQTPLTPSAPRFRLCRLGGPSHKVKSILGTADVHKTDGNRSSVVESATIRSCNSEGPWCESERQYFVAV